MSIAQCYRYFKTIVKMSPYDYLIHYRLLKSIDYLFDSTFNITEISEKVGFQNLTLPMSKDRGFLLPANIVG